MVTGAIVKVVAVAVGEVVGKKKFEGAAEEKTISLVRMEPTNQKETSRPIEKR